MRKLAAISVFLLLPALCFAAESAPELQPAHTNVRNTASLQRGAKYFVNYCMGCHSLKYERYQRLGDDLNLDTKTLQKGLMFAASKPTQMMDNAMPATQAANWFGKTPPDLTLEARKRGTAWIYTYLKSFYVDKSRPTGVNNTVLQNSAMPNVFWEEQGLRKAVFKQVTNAGGDKEQVFAHFKPLTKGTMGNQQFDAMVRDITNFLAYVGEPIQIERQSLGIKVLFFLAVLFIVFYLLKKEIWRDVH